MIALPLPVSYVFAEARAINDHRVICGTVWDWTRPNACVWRPTGNAYAPLSLPMPAGADMASAWGIGPDGSVVGNATRSGQTEFMRAVIWSAVGMPRDLGPLAPGASSTAAAIAQTKAGVEIVGSCERTPRKGDFAATLWRGNKLYDLNQCIEPTGEWRLWSAHAINAQGMIVGQGIHQGTQRAYLLAPVK